MAFITIYNVNKTPWTAGTECEALASVISEPPDWPRPSYSPTVTGESSGAMGKRDGVDSHATNSHPRHSVCIPTILSP